MAPAFRLDELAARIGGRVVGHAERTIRGLATLEDAGPEDLSFLTNPRYREAAERTRAGAVLLSPTQRLDAAVDRLEVARPQQALAALLGLYHPEAPRPPGVSPDARLGSGVRLGRDVRIEAFAVIGDGVRLGDRVEIGAGSVVGRGAEIGADTRLAPGVVLYPATTIGERCLIHAGVVLGADGFGFASEGGRHTKIPQVGRVVIGDDVEIGANSAVDRAALGATRIGSGSKLDDLVMLAHGVTLGEGCLLAAQTGIAGSTRVDDAATFAGQAGVAGHLHLGARAIVAAKSAVLEDLAADAFVAGIPAIDHRRWKRAQALVRQLPELRRKLAELERRLAAFERRGSEE